VTGDREWTPTDLNTMEGHLWKTPGEAVGDVEKTCSDGNDTKASGKTAPRTEGGSHRQSTVCGNSGRRSPGVRNVVPKTAGGRSEVQRASTLTGSVGRGTEGSMGDRREAMTDPARGDSDVELPRSCTEHPKGAAPHHLRMGKGRGNTGSGKPRKVRHGPHHASGCGREAGCRKDRKVLSAGRPVDRGTCRPANGGEP